MTPYTIRSHSALLADSSQLIAFIFLPALLITAADLSHSLRMTLNIPPYYNVLPSAVILNGHKNALWEKRETAT